MLIVHQIINSPIPSNCFVLYDKAVGDDCIIIDPGSRRDDEIFGYLDEKDLIPKYIILTHEHFDHCWGVNELVERYSIPIVCSSVCADFIRYEKKNCSVFYDNIERFVINTPTISIESLNNILSFAKTELRFFVSPGHSDASICFTIQKHLFTGDTLIKDVSTVTKLPTGSVKKLKESFELLSRFQGNGYIVCPGHGDVFRLDEYELSKIFRY